MLQVHRYSLKIKPVFYAGGIKTLLYEMRDLLDLEVKTISGNALGNNVTKPDYNTSEIIKSINDPIFNEGGLAVLKGSLALVFQNLVS